MENQWWNLWKNYYLFRVAKLKNIKYQWNWNHSKS
jgi:hypothetical protein